MKPAFVGLSGTELTDEERAFVAASDPAGYILLARNIRDPQQVRRLTGELRTLSGRGTLPVLIDQEGGRVARLSPPHWPAFPAARTFGSAFARAPVTAIEAARLNALALAATLLDLGLTVDCLPVLDLAHQGADAVIGDRSFGEDPLAVAALGDATLRGLREGGVVGVVKHVPGHGRAGADSHKALPIVDATLAELETDFLPFRRLAAAPMAMTAHVVFTALDASFPATCSPAVIDFIRNDIGFAGLLLSDDIGMEALSGPVAARADAALAAGVDIVLHCSGDRAETEALLRHLPEMGEAARSRLEAAMAWPQPQASDADFAALRDELLRAA